MSKVVDYFSRSIISISAELLWPYLVSFERCFVKLTFDNQNLKKSPHIVSEFDLKVVKFFAFKNFSVKYYSYYLFLQKLKRSNLFEIQYFKLREFVHLSHLAKRISQILNTLAHFLYLFTARILHT